MISIELVFALIMAASICGVAGYLGTLMVTKRMALMGGAFGHLTLPGIALALVFGFDVSIGAILFLTIGIVAIWVFERRTKLPTEALAAVVFPPSLAIAFLFLPENKTAQALIGDISQITIIPVIFTTFLCIVTFVIINRISKDILFTNISEDLAKSEGINIEKNSFIYLACIAIVVALGVRIVGGLLTAAIVSIPACTSSNISKNNQQYAYGGMVIGLMSGIIGVLTFSITNIATGPLIIITSVIFFIISVFFKKI
ncbi:MAG: metal ABC transporter permease [Candidatus Ranarchaeia archaeon]